MQLHFCTLEKNGNEDEEERSFVSFSQGVHPREITILYDDVKKVSGLAAWSENCKWYSSRPL